MVTPELLEFIKKQTNAGVPREEILASLRRNKWTEADLDNALNTLSNENTQTPPLTASAPATSTPTVSTMPSQVHKRSHRWVFVLGIVLVLAALGWMGWERGMLQNLPAPLAQLRDKFLENPNEEPKHLCFIWDHEGEAGSSMKLYMNIRGGDVLGKFHWLPAGKASKLGSFRGTLQPKQKGSAERTMAGWLNVTTEDEKWAEEFKINLGVGVAKVGWGPMDKKSEGVFVYNDPNNLSYKPELREIDCADEAVNQMTK